jgi:hypothetical protein
MAVQPPNPSRRKSIHDIGVPIEKLDPKVQEAAKRVDAQAQGPGRNVAITQTEVDQFATGADRTALSEAIKPVWFGAPQDTAAMKENYDKLPVGVLVAQFEGKRTGDSPMVVAEAETMLKSMQGRDVAELQGALDMEKQIAAGQGKTTNYRIETLTELVSDKGNAVD